MNTGIYLIRCAGYVYVGQSYKLTKRKQSHFGELRRGKHSNPIMQRLFNKYGEQSVSFSVVLHCKECDLDKYEQQVFNIFSRHYTMMNCGEFVTCTARGRPNLGASKAMKERHRNPEFAAIIKRNALSSAKHLHTDYAKQQYKKSMYRYWSNPNTLKERKDIMSKVWSKDGFRSIISDTARETMLKNWSNPEFAANVKERIKNQNADKEFTRKRLEGLAKKHNDVEFKRRRAEASAIKTRRAVMLTTTNQVFDSITEASEQDGWTSSKIKHHLAGRVKNPIWVYVEENLLTPTASSV